MYVLTEVNDVEQQRMPKQYRDFFNLLFSFENENRYVPSFSELVDSSLETSEFYYAFDFIVMHPDFVHYYIESRICETM